MSQPLHDPSAVTQGEVPEATNLSIDISPIIEALQVLAQDNKRIFTDLMKLRSMHDDNQRLNEELKRYRQGALHKSKEDCLRSVAKIYNQYKNSVPNPELSSFILTDLKGLLEDNEVEVIHSKPEDSFDKRLMKTYAEYVVLTGDVKKDRTVVESVELGYIFYGEPLIQEVVKMNKYDPSLAPLDTVENNEEIEEATASIEESSDNVELDEAQTGPNDEQKTET